MVLHENPMLDERDGGFSISRSPFPSNLGRRGLEGWPEACLTGLIA